MMFAAATHVPASHTFEKHSVWASHGRQRWVSPSQTAIVGAVHSSSVWPGVACTSVSSHSTQEPLAEWQVRSSAGRPEQSVSMVHAPPHSPSSQIGSAAGHDGSGPLASHETGGASGDASTSSHSG